MSAMTLMSVYFYLGSYEGLAFGQMNASKKERRAVLSWSRR